MILEQEGWLEPMLGPQRTCVRPCGASDMSPEMTPSAMEMENLLHGSAPIRPHSAAPRDGMPPDGHAHHQPISHIKRAKRAFSLPPRSSGPDFDASAHGCLPEPSRCQNSLTVSDRNRSIPTLPNAASSGTRKATFATPTQLPISSTPSSLYFEALAVGMLMAGRPDKSVLTFPGCYW